jgi:hypothetical protein
MGFSAAAKKKDGAGAPSLSGADWLLVNRQTTISEVATIALQRSWSSNSNIGLLRSGNMPIIYVACCRRQ